MMRALVISKEVEARAAEVMRHASLHRLTLSDLMRRMNRPGDAPGDDDNFVLKIHDGYRVVYTFEQQPEPLGWCHHVSVSVSQRGPRPLWPHEKAVTMGVLPLFGLDMKNVAKVWTEPTVFAVNMIFKVTTPI